MVSRFRRTLSFSAPNPIRPSSQEKSYHIRSTSFPCRSHHPLISQLKDAINELRTWVSSNPHPLSHGLNRLQSVHDSLDDLLQLPRTQDSLRRRPDWVDKLLEDFLRFVDAYSIFRTALMALKEQHLAVQVTVRRRDDSNIASYIKARKRMDKEMSKLISVVRCIGRRRRSSVPPPAASLSDVDVELAGVFRDVNDVTVSVSISLFNGMMSSSSSSSLKHWMLWGSSKKVKAAEEGIREFGEVGVERLCQLKKQGEEQVRLTLGRLQAMEDCIVGIENASERVFRSLINTRVSLLNILTDR
ncbi:PREDICTED: uncharacterized protein LOC104587100 [Nelumbo nucifera]|uniref:Uncharacterized protein LOC104587100 n=1 Tax=Nelumbo nucifera TaxID=4432 RepID=A0A1U7Z7A7_NELNU|nr:PREDICTED: uncharacterized protein LOC104587100 [Nelumbo nucifera]